MSEKTIHHLTEVEDIYWRQIHDIMNEHGYMATKDGKHRMSERVKATGEVFTPTQLVLKLMREMPTSAFMPGKNVLDPACGDGQFLVPAALLKVTLAEKMHPSVKRNKEKHLMCRRAALQEVFGVDIMEDNVKITRERLLRALDLQNDEHAKIIVERNILVGDTLNPETPWEGQTDLDKARMNELFSNQVRAPMEDYVQKKLSSV